MSDEELVRRMKNDDEIATEIIVRKYYDEIYSFLCRKLSNSTEAEDITQIVFIKFVNNIHTYNERGKLKNYLFKLAVNASNDYYRKNLKYKLSEYKLEDVCSDEVALDELVHKKEIANKVKEGLDKLPLYQKDVIIMRFYHDLKFQDIAKIMKSNISSTKSRYQQGIKKLKTILKEVHRYE